MTYLRDLVSNFFKNMSGTPAARTAAITAGTAIDCISTDGPMNAIQDIGTVSGTSPTWDGKIQESDTTTSGDFADITGAVFTQVTASTNIQCIQFQRTKRYVRYVAAIGGSSTPTFGVDVLLIGQIKKIGA
jgi:hypothetical protein